MPVPGGIRAAYAGLPGRSSAALRPPPPTGWRLPRGLDSASCPGAGPPACPDARSGRLPRGQVRPVARDQIRRAGRLPGAKSGRLPRARLGRGLLVTRRGGLAGAAAAADQEKCIPPATQLSVNSRYSLDLTRRL